MKKRAWVLSGGGAAGSVQFGIADTIWEACKPDMLFGTSAGALNSFALGKAGPANAVELWKELKSESDVFSLNKWPPAPFAPGLKNFGPLRKKLQRIHDEFPIASTPFWVCTLNLSTGQKAYFAHNAPDVVSMTLASASMEGYVEPVQIAGHWYADGGAVENVPLEAAIQMGADEIFVLLCHPFKERLDDSVWKPKNLFNTLFRTYEARSLEMLRADVLKHRRDVKIHVIAPEFVVLSTLDFDEQKIKDGIAYGRELGAKFLQNKTATEQAAAARVSRKALRRMSKNSK